MGSLFQSAPGKKVFHNFLRNSKNGTGGGSILSLMVLVANTRSVVAFDDSATGGTAPTVEGVFGAQRDSSSPLVISMDDIDAASGERTVE
jgi:hypothetical protein